MKTFKEFVNEANTQINTPEANDVKDAVESFFWNNYSEDGDSLEDEKQRQEDIEYMADHSNDPATDYCVSYVAEELNKNEDYIADKYRELIEDELARLAADELENF